MPTTVTETTTETTFSSNRRRYQLSKQTALDTPIYKSGSRAEYVCLFAHTCKEKKYCSIAAAVCTVLTTKCLMSGVLLTACQLIPCVKCARGNKCADGHLDEGDYVKWIDRMGPDFVDSIGAVLDEGTL